MTVDEAIICLSDMKIKVAIPKAAVTQIKRNLALDMAINALNCSEIPNNSDTISRQQAIDAVSSCGICIQRIVNLPSVQPKRKKGTWTDDASCPFCGFQPWYERDIHTLSFCPNCGADMRGEQDE